jgi:hypothetical protein
VFQQQKQELERLVTQVKTDAMFAQFAGADIEREGSEAI